MLTLKQKRAIDAMVTTSTKTKAAARAGCARRSIYMWLKKPEFKEALLLRENELRSQAGRTAALYANEALEFLHEIFRNERYDVSVRRLAARDLLSYLTQTGNDFALDIRITQLEVNYEKQQSKN